MRGRLAAAVPVALLAACGGPLSVFAPASEAAERLASLIGFFLWVTLVPAVAAVALLLFALARPRPDRPVRLENALLAAGVLVPLAAIALLFGRSLADADLGGARPGDGPALRIEVIGHQYWFEVRYPDHGIVTATEVHVPVGRRVELRLSSADVIHSFWIPRVQGKLDMVPGQVNTLSFAVGQAGVHRGLCTEFCGTQHALMGLLLVAHPPDRFEAWLDERGGPPPPPADPAAARGPDHFARWCAECHAVRGRFDAAVPLAGPDLTGLAARLTLGSATLPNDRGHLAGWILDPAAHKPGVRMPPTPLSPAELHELVSWLETLR